MKQGEIAHKKLKKPECKLVIFVGPSIEEVYGRLADIILEKFGKYKDGGAAANMVRKKRSALSVFERFYK